MPFSHFGHFMAFLFFFFSAAMAWQNPGYTQRREKRREEKRREEKRREEKRREEKRREEKRREEKRREEKRREETKGVRFVATHIYKVYKLFLCSIALYILLRFPYYDFDKILRVLTLTTNFSQSTLFMVCGPWWFFSLIIQLYILFLLLFKFINQHKSNILLLWIFYIVVAIGCLDYNPNTVLYANAIGHLPEFSLGIFIAIYEKELTFLNNKKFNLAVFVVSVAIIIGAQLSLYIFILGFAASVTMTLSFFRLINWEQNAFLEFTGKLSPFLFGFNGFLFRNYFSHLAYISDSAALKLVYGLAWLAANYAVAFMAYKFLRQKWKFL